MLKSSVLEVLRTFSPAELKSFELFLRSPYHNTIANTVKLFKVIKEFAPEFNSDELDKEVVWQKVFPGKKYNYGTMKNLIHHLSKLSTKFISLEQVTSADPLMNVALISSLTSRNITKLFPVKIKEIEKFHDSGSFRNLNFGLSEYYTEMSKIFWMKWNFNKKNVKKRDSEKDFFAGSATFIYGFLINLFKSCHNVKVQSGDLNYSIVKDPIINFVNEIGFDTIEKIILKAKEDSEREFIFLSVFWNMCKSVLTGAHVENYMSFKKSLEENAEAFIKNDLKDLLMCLVSAASNQKESDVNIYKERIDIFNIMIKNKLFMQPTGFLPLHLFHNYTWNLYNLGDFSGIKEFTNKYINKLTEDLRENALNVSNIYLQIGKYKFQEALAIISTIKIDYFKMKVFLKQLKAVCFFELDDYVSFTFENESLRMFMSSNPSLSPETRNSLSVFFSRVDRMFKLKETHDQFEFDKLNNEILLSKSDESCWLCRKMNELLEKLKLKVKS